MSKLIKSCNQLHGALIDPFGKMKTSNPIEAIERVRNQFELIKIECGEGAANEAMIHSYVMAMYQQHGDAT